MPSTFDEGAVVIEATAIQRNGKDQQYIASTHFIIQVQPPKDEELMWSSNNGPIRYDQSDFKSLSSNQQLEQRCEWDENFFRAVLVLDTSLNELDVERRVKLICKFANFVSHRASGITMSTRQSAAVARLLDKHVVAAGPGDTNITSHPGLEVGWFLGCGVTFPHIQDFIQVIEHNIKTGRIRKEVGFNAIGWQVIESQPPEPIKKIRRQKRQALRTPILAPGILPSTSGISVHPTPFVESSVDMTSAALIPSSSSAPDISSSTSESVVASSLNEFQVSTRSPMLVISSETVPTSSVIDTRSSSMIESTFPASQQKMFSSFNISQEYTSENHYIATSQIENVFSTWEVVLTDEEVSFSELSSGESLPGLVTEPSTGSLEMFPEITMTTTNAPMISFVEISSTNTSSDFFLEASTEATTEISTSVSPSPSLQKSSSQDPIERLSSYDDTSAFHTSLNETVLPGVSLTIQSLFESDPLPSFSEIGTGSAVSVGSYSSAAMTGTMTVQFNNSLIAIVDTQSTVITPSFTQHTSTTPSLMESDLFKSAEDSSLARDIDLSENELLPSSTELESVIHTMNITTSELLKPDAIVSSTAPLELDPSIDSSSVPIPFFTEQPYVFTEGHFSTHVPLPETIASTSSVQNQVSAFPSDTAFSMSLEPSAFITNVDSDSVSVLTAQALKTQGIRISSVLSDTFSSAIMDTTTEVTNISNFLPVSPSEVSVTSVQSFTLVGPPRTAKLTIMLESLRASLAGGIYASAGFEDSDDLVSTTAEFLATGTEETISTVAIESKIMSTSLPFMESSAGSSTPIDIPTESNSLTTGEDCCYRNCACVLYVYLQLLILAFGSFEQFTVRLVQSILCLAVI